MSTGSIDSVWDEQSSWDWSCWLPPTSFARSRSRRHSRRQACWRSSSQSELSSASASKWNSTVDGPGARRQTQPHLPLGIRRRNSPKPHVRERHLPSAHLVGKTPAMARHAPNGYWLIDAVTNERLERHCTRQAAVDNWRLRFAGRPIKIVRHYDSGDEVLVVEGTWHQSTTS